MRMLEVKQRKYFILSPRHKVTNMWLYGTNFNEWKFTDGNTRKVIEFLHTTYPRYEKFVTVKIFVYRTIDRIRDADVMSSTDPFRNLRGEDKPKVKHKNPHIVELVDELLSDVKSKANEDYFDMVPTFLSLPLSTIYHIVQDLSFGWTKPWHTDILTPVQKQVKKKVVLLSTDPALRWCVPVEIFAVTVHRREMVWPCWSCCGKILQRQDKMERKLQSQVYFFCVNFWPCVFFLMSFTQTQHYHRSLTTKVKKEV